MLYMQLSRLILEQLYEVGMIRFSLWKRKAYVVKPLVQGRICY